jgi:hypothetical protein
MKRFNLLLLFLTMISAFLAGQSSFDSWDQLLSRAGFEENWEVRQSYRNTINAPFYSMMHAPSSIVKQVISPVNVKFELRRAETSFYMLFINEKEMNYPTLGRGNWIIKRDIRTGDFLQAKIFLQNDRDTFVRLFPGEDRAYMDIFLYGRQIYSSIPVSVDFEELMLTPFSRIISLTENIVDWSQLFTDRHYEEWSILSELTQKIQMGTARLTYVDDGAMNSLGDWVYINTGEPQEEEIPGVNCSGFLKWVADGFYGSAPFSEKERFNFEELRRRPANWKEAASSWNRNFDDRDPWFGLVWTRNISSLLRKSFTNLETEYSRMDVDNVPFYDYKEEVGYPTEELDTILYLQAVNSPGRIYWGAVNGLYRPEGEEVTMWQYYHTVLFIPRFTPEGDFLCDVFQSGDWTSLEIFQDQHKGSWTHLSASDGLRAFNPPSLP